ncbi:Hint domain-containing protein [Paracoccus rhizosphaerae]|nr:Hint domain-containing protein [Paracoccus rhizosphaerae]
MTTFTIRGDQLIVDPAVGTNSSEGTATVQWGRQLWSKGHTIELTAVNDTGTELTGQSGITGLKVFDSAGLLVAEYRPMNPGQTASIQSDISGLGDSYARINTTVMQPSPGAPWLGPIMITNGDNTFSSLPITFHVGNGAYDITPTNQNLPTATQPLDAPPCFGPDVPVDVVRRGVIPVRLVEAGDMILTSEGRQPVLWTGRRLCACKLEREWPVEINGELFSPLHRIFWRGRWAKAKHLAEAGRASRRSDCHEIYYHHVLLPLHSIILTGRNQVESLLVTPYSLSLWKGTDAGLQDHKDASRDLGYGEWKRGELLRHERTAELVDVKVPAQKAF